MVTVKWPEPSLHRTDKVTYYWLQARCKDASKYGRKCFLAVTAGDCTFSTMGHWTIDINCVHYGVCDLLRYLIDCRCLFACLCNQPAGWRRAQRSGCFQSKQLGIEPLTLTLCEGSLPEYSEYSLTPRTRLFSMVDYNSPHYSLFILSVFHFLIASLSPFLPTYAPTLQEENLCYCGHLYEFKSHFELRVRSFI